MSFFDWMNGFASIVAITGGISGLVWWRKSKIDTLRSDLANSWTNEGDISSREECFINLKLGLESGDLQGRLVIPGDDECYDVNVYPKGFWAIAYVTSFKGRKAWPIATVRLSLRGNRNRLHWKICSKEFPDFVPKKTILWRIASESVANSS